MVYSKREPNELSLANIVAMERQVKVEQLFIQGVPRSQIAVRLGVAVNTISTDLDDVFERMGKRWKELDRERALLLRQNDHLIFEALNSFEVSKQTAERTTTNYNPKRCPECKGTGMVGEAKDVWCVTCDGTGKIVEEVVTREVKGQAGDASFLNTFGAALDRKAKLMGLGRRKGKKPGGDLHLHAHVNGELDLSRADPELLLKAESAYRKLLESVKGSKVIDVEAKGDSE